MQTPSTHPSPDDHLEEALVQHLPEGSPPLPERQKIVVQQLIEKIERTLDPGAIREKQQRLPSTPEGRAQERTPFGDLGMSAAANHANMANRINTEQAINWFIAILMQEATQKDLGPEAWVIVFRILIEKLTTIGIELPSPYAGEAGRALYGVSKGV